MVPAARAGRSASAGSRLIAVELGLGGPCGKAFSEKALKPLPFFSPHVPATPLSFSKLFRRAERHSSCDSEKEEQDMEGVPWIKKWQPTPMSFPGKAHGPRSLAGYSPRDRKTVRRDLGTKQQQVCSLALSF